MCVREYEVLGRREIDSRYRPAGGVRVEEIREAKRVLHNVSVCHQRKKTE